MTESFMFEGVPIHCDLTFEDLGEMDAAQAQAYAQRVVVVSQAAAAAIEEGQAKLGRRLRADEVISCMIHRNCIAVLECAAEDQ